MITLRSVAMFSFMTACLVGCEGARSPVASFRDSAGNVVLVVDENTCGKVEGLGQRQRCHPGFMGRASRPIVASGVTEASGDFRFPLTNKDAERYELQVTATKHPGQRISKDAFSSPLPANAGARRDPGRSSR